MTRIGILFVLLLGAQSLFADIIQLRDGRTLRGRIISQDNDAISIQAADGDYLIYRNQIVRTLYDDPSVLRAQEERERQREIPTYRPPQTNTEPDRRSTAPKKQEAPDHTGFYFGISGGTGKHSSVYSEYLKSEKQAEYIQQSQAFTHSVAYPYEESHSRPKSYAAYAYYESKRWFAGLESEMSRESSGYQMYETLTDSGRGYAGSGSLNSVTDQISRARFGFLLGSAESFFKPFIFAGPMYLESKAKGNQTEFVTLTNLSYSAVYSPSLEHRTRAKGIEAGLEGRFEFGSGLELRLRAAGGQMKGGFKYSELRLPLVDASLYETGTVYPTLADQASKLRVTSAQYGGSFYFPAGSHLRFFIDAGVTSLKYKVEATGTIRLPDSLLNPGENIHADLYRSFTGRQFPDRATMARFGIEFHP
ncbi:MAG: hypothetical protein K8S54_06470 [Spirochaetia bacterium]|nr:hypothetical protein [Spirochaetia bacterium]